MYYDNTNVLYINANDCKNCSHYSVCKWIESMSQMKTKIEQINGATQITSPIVAKVTCNMFSENVKTIGRGSGDKINNDWFRVTSGHSTTSHLKMDSQKSHWL